MDDLTQEQRLVVQGFLEEQQRQREHLVVHLSGAHAYGFASPNSDVDLKAIHIAPTEAFLGLAQPPTTAEQFQVIDGVELDYTSNEIALALRGVLKGDGNMLERVMSQAPLLANETLAELVELVEVNLSKRYFNHYRGFATSQRRTLEKAERPTAKKALYVLRTALTGAHLLETHRCVPDLTALAGGFGFSEAFDLIDIKRSDEASALPPSLAGALPALLDRAFERLEQAHDRSSLPDAPPAASELERWLVEFRRRQLGHGAEE